ncbi:ATP-grasp domain-containing protein [Streptomyces chrestomyceticus]|uniref:ATP-grasp domain-containing protein n=1 Tax=Streptomyces chrestomyceticus TaxID=68185 RepID=UPI0037B27DF2
MTSQIIGNAPAPQQEKQPVILLDRLGYSSYRGPDGRPFLPTDRWEVRLVTALERTGEAVGDELASVVGVPGVEPAPFADAVRFQHRWGGRPAARLVAVTERFLLPAAELREELGIPGQRVEQALLFRDKVLMKEHLRDHGIAVPDFAPFSREAALTLLDKYHRVVVKPRLGAGSSEIHVLDDTVGLDRFVREHVDRLEEFEVEEFVDGQLYHVDSVVQDSHVTAAVAGRYVDSTMSYRRLEPCRDIAVPDGPLLDALLAFDQAVLAAYPGFTGVAHHEVFMSLSGPVFCEIAARAGGGGILAGFRSRTGANLDEVMLRAQLDGSVPHVPAPASHLTGFTALYAEPGRVLRTPVVPDEPWITEAQILVGEGDLIDPPTRYSDAAAIVSVRGDTEAQVMSRLAALAERISIPTVPEAP